MSHHRSQLNYPEGSIEIHFNMEYDGNAITVDTIQIHTNPEFNSGLPHSPTMEWHDNKWKLAAHYDVMKGSEVVKRIEYLDTIWSNLVVQEILRIKEQATPNFQK